MTLNDTVGPLSFLNMNRVGGNFFLVFANFIYGWSLLAAVGLRVVVLEQLHLGGGDAEEDGAAVLDALAHHPLEDVLQPHVHLSRPRVHLKRW